MDDPCDPRRTLHGRPGHGCPRSHRARPCAPVAAQAAAGTTRPSTSPEPLACADPEPVPGDPDPRRRLRPRRGARDRLGGCCRAPRRTAPPSCWCWRWRPWRPGSHCCPAWPTACRPGARTWSSRPPSSASPSPSWPRRTPRATCAGSSSGPRRSPPSSLPPRTARLHLGWSAALLAVRASPAGRARGGGGVRVGHDQRHGRSGGGPGVVDLARRADERGRSPARPPCGTR